MVVRFFNEKAVYFFIAFFSIFSKELSSLQANDDRPELFIEAIQAIPLPPQTSPYQDWLEKIAAAQSDESKIDRRPGILAPPAERPSSPENDLSQMNPRNYDFLEESESENQP